MWRSSNSLSRQREPSSKIYLDIAVASICPGQESHFSNDKGVFEKSISFWIHCPLKTVANYID